MELFQLAAKGDVKSIERFLADHRQLDVNVVNDQGFSLVSMAAAEGRLNVVDLLIRHGAPYSDDERPPKADWDPLHLAVKRNHVSVVQLLVDRGANVNARNYKGEAVLELALQGGDPRICQYLLDHGASLEQVGSSPMDLALRSCSVSLLQLLVDHGCHFDARHDVTPFHYIILRDYNRCCYPGYNSSAHVEVFHFLLSLPSLNIDQESSKHGTPLNYGLKLRRYHLTSMLILKGADLSLCNLDSFRFSTDALQTLKLFYYSGFKFSVKRFSKNCQPEAPKDSQIKRDMGITCCRPSCGWLTDQEHKNEVSQFHKFCRWLEVKNKSPERLNILCLIAIRKHFGRNLRLFLTHKKVPRSIEAMITLRNLLL